MIQEFPSPTGVLYLLIILMLGIICIRKIRKVSVPYWGSLSSNTMTFVTVVNIVYKFPSPTGVLYLLILTNEIGGNKRYSVSVPYWGSLSSNP